MFRIREAHEADNEALLRLEAESPQGTGLSVNIDRDTYFYRTGVFDTAKVIVGEEDGHLVGIMAYALKTVFVAGEPTRVAYFYDLRGDASYRRSMKRGLFRMWRAVDAEVRDAGAAFLYGHVKADNEDSLRVSTKSGAQPAASSGILTLPTLATRGPSLDPLRPSIEDAVGRIEEAVGTRDMRPESIVPIYRGGAEAGYLQGIYRLEGKRSYAQISVWDTSSIFRGVVFRMPLWLKLLGGAFNPLSRFVPVPRIPTVGQRIAYWQLFDPLSGGPQGKHLLRRLIQWLRHEGFRHSIDITMLFYYDPDPAFELPTFVPSKTLAYRTMVRPYGDTFPTPPLYLDIRDV
jgi:hypothetical protein